MMKILTQKMLRAQGSQQNSMGRISAVCL